MHASKLTYVDQTLEQVGEIASRDFVLSWGRSLALNNDTIVKWLKERTDVISDVALLFHSSVVWRLFSATPHPMTLKLYSILLHTSKSSCATSHQQTPLECSMRKIITTPFPLLNLEYLAGFL